MEILARLYKAFTAARELSLGVGLDRIRRGAKIEPVAATWGEHSPSVARALSRSDVADLAAIANGLPESWVVTIEPPHGQLAIVPIAQRRRYHRAYVASRKLGRIYRDSGLDAA